MLQPKVYSMQIMNLDGSLTQWPYHLGTDEAVATTIAMQTLTARLSPSPHYKQAAVVNLFYGSSIVNVITPEDLP